MPSPPYVYAPSQRYSATSDTLYGFDPKAVTKASRSPPKKPPPRKQDGPLVDFNKHPDSYNLLPTGQQNANPISPRTKVVIKSMRWVQLGFRLLQLIGAIGMLICVICIKGTQDTEGWIIRVPAALDILCGLYAIYHLVHHVRSRSASSSAGYHFFALVIDTGLIPFYVFTALLANSNWQEAPGTSGRWRTFFKTDSATNKILLTTWLASVTTGALHLISCGIGLYLVLVFRKISHLPFDLNPLEDNLTSRRATRHKHKSSSLSNITVAPENRFSTMSGTTVNSYSPSRMSHSHEPLMADVRTVPFEHSRNNSDTAYNPHNPRSARVYTSDQSPPKLDLKNLPIKIAADSPGGYDSMSPASSPARSSPGRSSRSTKRKSMKSDNWFVYPAPEASPADDNEEEEHSANVPLVRRYSFETNDDAPSKSLNIYKDIENHGPLSPMSDNETARALRPEPLRMNPPTPSPNPPEPTPPMPFQSNIGSIYSDRSSTMGRTFTINSTVTRTTDNWTYFPQGHHHHHTSSGPSTRPGTSGTLATTISSPAPSITTSTSTKKQARYYGDLAAARASIAGRYSPTKSASPSPARPPVHLDPVLAQRLHLAGGGTKRAMGRSPQRPGYERVETSPRVVSSSGVDAEVVEGDLGLGYGVGEQKVGGRARVVSGRQAEEGMAGEFGASVTRRKVSGMV